MLRVVSGSPTSSRSIPRLSPAWPLEPNLVSLVFPGFLPRLWDMAAPFPFQVHLLGQLSTCPRHAEHLQNLHMACLHKDAVPHRTHITSEQHRERHPLLLCGWQRQKVSCVVTHINVQAHKHSHRFPEYSMTLLAIWCPFWDSRPSFPPLGSSICQLL